MEDNGRFGRRATKLATTVKLSGAYMGLPGSPCTFQPATNALKIGDTLPWDMYPTLDERNGAAR
jgi:hypothetical protein